MFNNVAKNLLSINNNNFLIPKIENHKEPNISHLNTELREKIKKYINFKQIDLEKRNKEILEIHDNISYSFSDDNMNDLVKENYGIKEEKEYIKYNDKMYNNFEIKNPSNTNPKKNSISQNNNIPTNNYNIKREKPTHFISLPLTFNRQSEMAFKKLQERLSNIDNTFSKHLYNKQPHLTLGVLNLEESQLDIVISLFDNFKYNIKSYLKAFKNIKNKNEQDTSFKLTFKGLDFFYDKFDKQAANVIFTNFANDKHKQAIYYITDIFINSLLELGIIEKSDLSFIKFNEQNQQFENEKLHWTLIKGAKFEINKIPNDLWDYFIGDIYVNRISLCKMDKYLTELVSIDLKN